MGLRSIGKRLCIRLGLNPELQHVPRPIILYSAVCGIYNANHEFFHLVYTDEEGMEMIFNNVCQNINLVNTLSCVEFPIELEHRPHENDTDWTRTTVKNLDDALKEMPFGLAEITEDDLAYFLNLSGGRDK